MTVFEEEEGAIFKLLSEVISEGVIIVNSQQEIVASTQKLAAAARDGELDPASITTDMFAGALTTAGLPAPELLIRTSGEQRLSNFLL